jgi:hypothetical protein
MSCCQFRIEIVGVIDGQPGGRIQNHVIDTAAVEHQPVSSLIKTQLHISSYTLEQPGIWKTPGAPKPVSKAGMSHPLTCVS